MERERERYLLGVCDAEDLSTESPDEGGRLIDRGELGYGDMGRLVDTLPILDLRNTKRPTSAVSIVPISLKPGLSQPCLWRATLL